LKFSYTEIITFIIVAAVILELEHLLWLPFNSMATYRIFILKCCVFVLPLFTQFQWQIKQH